MTYRLLLASFFLVLGFNAQASMDRVRGASGDAGPTCPPATLSEPSDANEAKSEVAPPTVARSRPEPLPTWWPRMPPNTPPATAPRPLPWPGLVTCSMLSTTPHSLQGAALAGAALSGIWAIRPGSVTGGGGVPRSLRLL